MKTFKLEAKVTISLYTEVEAENLENAIEEAEGRTIENAQWGQDTLKNYSWVSDDFDGEVFDICEA